MERRLLRVADMVLFRTLRVLLRLVDSLAVVVLLRLDERQLDPRGSWTSALTSHELSASISDNNSDNRSSSSKDSARRRPLVIYLWFHLSLIFSFRSSVRPFLSLPIVLSFPFMSGSCTRAFWPTYVYKHPEAPAPGNIRVNNQYFLSTPTTCWQRQCHPRPSNRCCSTLRDRCGC
jgi:hypothetical protein